MKVEEFMSRSVVTLEESHTVQEAAELMVEKGFSILPIVDAKNNLLGLITESDFVGKEVEIPHALASLKQLFGQTYHLEDIEKVYRESRNTPLGKVMSRRVRTVSKDATLSSVVDLMVSYHLKRIPVVDDGKLVGIITRKDLMKAFKDINN